MILIESSHWRLWNAPDTGVQWLAAQVKRKDEWYDVVPDCRPSSDSASPDDHSEPAAGQSAMAPLPAANFHMIPYSNRIRDGRFNFNGHDIQLESANTHAIHGALRKLPWRVTSSDTSSLVCEFDSRIEGPINWPWPILARIEQTVNGATLSSTISIRNLGNTSMPVGTGWHPYFVRNIGQSAATLTLPVKSVFPDETGDCLPDGAAVPLPAELDFRTPRVLDPDQRIDCCLAGLSGACHIHWQDAGIELVMAASDACRFLVLFNPDMPHFAVEPVTNANDAFNLASDGVDSGSCTLPAGEEFNVSMSIEARVHE
ncbi:MAG: hypothetical protein AB8B64_17300 [Granulosicoccus sp.]